MMKRSSLFVICSVIVASLLFSSCASAPQKIRVATDPTWPPFEKIDEQTQIVEGIDIDLINAIAAKEGLVIDFVAVPFETLKIGLAQCQYDAAISSITITEDRKKDFSFSESYFEAGQIVTVRKDNADIQGKDSLTGKTVGAEAGTTGADEAGKIPGAKLVTVDDIDILFQNLMNGEVDAVIADNPLAMNYVAKNPDKLKTVGIIFTGEQYGIAVCKTNTALLDKINKGLAAVKTEGGIDQITSKWMGK